VQPSPEALALAAAYSPITWPNLKIRSSAYLMAGRFRRISWKRFQENMGPSPGIAPQASGSRGPMELSDQVKVGDSLSGTGAGHLPIPGDEDSVPPGECRRHLFPTPASSRSQKSPAKSAKPDETVAQPPEAFQEYVHPLACYTNRSPIYTRPPFHGRKAEPPGR